MVRIIQRKRDIQRESEIICVCEYPSLIMQGSHLTPGHTSASHLVGKSMCQKKWYISLRPDNFCVIHLAKNIQKNVPIFCHYSISIGVVPRLTFWVEIIQPKTNNIFHIAVLHNFLCIDGLLPNHNYAYSVRYTHTHTEIIIVTISDLLLVLQINKAQEFFPLIIRNICNYYIIIILIDFHQKNRVVFLHWFSHLLLLLHYLDKYYNQLLNYNH